MTEQKQLNQQWQAVLIREAIQFRMNEIVKQLPPDSEEIKELHRLVREWDTVC